MTAVPHFVRRSTIFIVLLACALMLAFNFTASTQGTAPQDFKEREEGVRLYEQDNIEGALTALRLATKKHKEDGIAWHFLGLTLNRSGNVKDAGSVSRGRNG